MLLSLTIKNYVLIEYLELNLGKSLNIITGETGAGKSIILGAIGLLAGERADTKSLLDADQKCIVEGIFNLEGYQLKNIFEHHSLDYESQSTIRREISPQGKSRAFINDTPVTLEVLKEITNRLLDIHSQHDNLTLSTQDFQLDMVDLYAQNKAFLLAYQTSFSEYKNLQKEIIQLKEISQSASKTFEFENFQFHELKQAKLIESEQAELEAELIVLENAEEIKTKLSLCVQAIEEGEISVQSGLTLVNSTLAQLSKLSPEFEPFKDKIQSILIEVKDINRELDKNNERIEADPQRCFEVKERLDLIYKLQKKHGVSEIKKLLEIQDSLEQKIKLYSQSDEKLVDLEKKFAKIETQLKIKAAELTISREKVFREMENRIISLLHNLGMEHNSFKIENKIVDFSKEGQDKISMMFSANKGIAPVVLKQAASGGEFSRLMFALKYLIAEKSFLPTIIFDEIDTGISGEIAQKMGVMMEKMSSNHQLITITHQHQIAAKGENHFYVYKSETEKGTKTNIKELTSNERLLEIASMIGGKNPSQTALESARELMGK
jgi:DNA repair protein RecN (Recombination protein N)